MGRSRKDPYSRTEEIETNPSLPLDISSPPPLVGHVNFKYLHLPLDIYVVHAFCLINLSIHQQHYFLQSATPWINVHLNASPLRRHFSPSLNGKNFLLGGGMDLFLDWPNNYYTFCHTILEIYGYTVMQESLLPKLRVCLNCQSHLKLRHCFNLKVDSRMKWIRPPGSLRTKNVWKTFASKYGVLHLASKYGQNWKKLHFAFSLIGLRSILDQTIWRCVPFIAAFFLHSHVHTVAGVPGLGPSLKSVIFRVDFKKH